MKFSYKFLIVAFCERHRRPFNRVGSTARSIVASISDLSWLECIAKLITELIVLTARGKSLAEGTEGASVGAAGCFPFVSNFPGHDLNSPLQQNVGVPIGNRDSWLRIGFNIDWPVHGAITRRIWRL
jgi:hypothetical protein